MPLLWALPVVGVLGVVPLWWVSERAYWAIVGEDRLAEWATFLVYAVVAGLSVVVGRRLARRGHRADAVLFGLLAPADVFIAGEEVSWFQRQLDFHGPDELVARNQQGEANLHNLLGRLALDGTYIVVGLYGSFLARVIVPRLPLLRQRPWLYVPPLSLTTWFGCAWVYYAWADYVNPPVLTRVFGPSVDVVELTGPKLQEVVELALAAGFLLFLLRLVRRPDVTEGDVKPVPTTRSRVTP